MDENRDDRVVKVVKNVRVTHLPGVAVDNEDLGVTQLEKNDTSSGCSAPKHMRYLNPNSTIWPMGYGLVTSLIQFKHKKPTILINHFDKLPEEVILCIFKMLNKRTLTKCAYVCKKWRRISYDESLWQSLNIPHRRLSIMTLDHLLRRNIKHLSISHSNIFSTNYAFETQLAKLQYLDVSAVFIPVEVLSSLLGQCCNLVKLSLENCNVNYTCCQNIANNTNLKVLNLASTTGLDKTGLEFLTKLENVEEFNISWAHIKDADLHFLIMKMMKSITRLNISGFLKKLTDNDLKSLVNRCPGLIELDISDSLAITSESLDFVLRNEINLRALSMSRCYNVSSAFLQPVKLRMKMGKNMDGLKELNVFGITDIQSFLALCACYIDFNINKSLFSCIARPKPADNEHTIWEIPVHVDC